MEILEMKQKRAALVKEARKLLDTAEKEKRELTGEETAKYEEMMKEVDSWGTKIEREENLRKMEEALKVPEPTVVPPQPTEPEARTNPRATEEYRKSFEKFLRSGINTLTEKEVRAMQADDPEGGGYLVAPQLFVSEMLKAVDNTVFVRGLARKFSLAKAASLGVPKLDTDFSDADWVSELATGDEDTLDYGKRELRPHALSKLVKVSNTLIRLSTESIEAMIRERLSYRFSVTLENAYLNGDGLQKPLGVFTADADGINTDRDVSTGNTDSSIKADGLIEAKYTLKTPYLRNARWVFHRDAVKQIRKLKDGAGQYLWQPGITADMLDEILGIPIIVSEYAPSTFTTGKYVGILGDFSYYWIADALDMQVQRLVELYAATNQVGYIARFETDGMPVLSEAFVRVTLG
ncbi:phage major capsid protein [Mesotoga sp.]|uniref:phage major capsid protein n=1 Tax=Mesotoga sp. TaxID=2053577 RepID=UPI00345E3DD2